MRGDLIVELREVGAATRGGFEKLRIHAEELARGVEVDGGRRGADGLDAEHKCVIYGCQESSMNAVHPKPE